MFASKHRLSLVLVQGGGPFWEYDFGKAWGGAGSQTTNRPKKPKEEEEFYGFSQFFDDLEKEWSTRSTKRAARDKPKSLWEELNELGAQLWYLLVMLLLLNTISG